MKERPNSLLDRQIKEVSIVKITHEGAQTKLDKIAIEEPLEIQLSYMEQQQRTKRSLVITMRTPGADVRLAYGFLFTEGIIGKVEDIKQFQQIGNTIKLFLQDDIQVSLENSERSFYMHSSCGICGKKALDSLEKITSYYPLPNEPRLTSAIIGQLSSQLRAAQSVFEETGGIHAAGLFDAAGKLLHFEEDIGRHNALDKVIGYGLENRLFPMRNLVLLLSGRISYELVQKASLVGIPIIVAVGAPSSMAIELAIAMDITLIGFLRNNHFNIYSGQNRIFTG